MKSQSINSAAAQALNLTSSGIKAAGNDMGDFKAILKASKSISKEDNRKTDDNYVSKDENKKENALDKKVKEATEDIQKTQDDEITGIAGTNAQNQTSQISAKEMMAFMDIVAGFEENLQGIQNSPQTQNSVNTESVELNILSNQGQTIKNQDQNLQTKDLDKKPNSHSEIKLPKVEMTKENLNENLKLNTENKNTEVKNQTHESQILNKVTATEETGIEALELKMEKSNNPEEAKIAENQENQQISEVKIPQKEPVITVKVGDLQEAKPTEFLKQISEKILIKNQGNSQYEIQLDPANLGKIKVKISFEEGCTTVSLICTNSKTMSILSNNASNLGAMLQDTSKTDIVINVQKDESLINDSQKEDNKGQQGHNQKESNQNNKNDSNEEFIDKMKMNLWEIENLRMQTKIN